jgi:hypothetical protein
MWIWRELGIEQTKDERQIRRAYALRLKALDQQADPAGFERLRNAYERALARAREDEADRHDGPVAAETDPGPTAPSPEEAAPRDEEDERTQRIKRAIDDALRSRSVEDVATLLQSPDAHIHLSLTDYQTAIEHLKALLLSDETIRGNDFLAVAAKFDWDGATVRHASRMSRLDHALINRLSAESWWARINDLATTIPAAAPEGLVQAARILLGKDSVWLAYVSNIRGAMAAILPHDHHPAAMAMDRLDPARLAWCRALVEGRHRSFRLWIALLKYVPVVALSGFYIGGIVLRPPVFVSVVIVFLLVVSLRRLELPKVWFYSAVMALVLIVVGAPSMRDLALGDKGASTAFVRAEPKVLNNVPLPSLAEPAMFPPAGDCGLTTQQWDPLSQDFDFKRFQPCPGKRRDRRLPTLPDPASLE